MSAVTDLSINDGAATPVAVTFRPISQEGGYLIFADFRNDVTAHWPLLKVRLERATASRKTHRVEVEFSYPLVRTVDTVDVVTDIARFRGGKFIIPETMTSTERKHLRAFVANAYDDVLISKYVTDIEPMF